MRAALVAAGVDADRIDACDPYTGDAYTRRIGKSAETWSFEDIAQGAASERHGCPTSLTSNKITDDGLT